MTTFENQITDYPKGARVETIVPILCHDGAIPLGTRGIVAAHCDDGRAWIFFDGYDAGHTFHEPEHYIRVVCTHRDDNCPANHEQPQLDQIACPECGYGWNEFTQGFHYTHCSRVKHLNDRQLLTEQPRPEQGSGEGDESWGNAIADVMERLAAPERGEWRVKVAGANVYILDADDNAIANLHNEQIAREIVERYEQHSTLVEQRERLTRILLAACSTLKSYQYGNVSPELAKEMIRTIEQVLTTIEQEGTR